MSKAILVVDMPNSCDKCDLHYMNECCEDICMKDHKYIEVNIFTKRPKWCPLREVPQKQTVHCTDTPHHRFAKDGWNHCIDTILKEGVK